MTKNLYLGIDIGGTKIAAGLVDPTATIIGYNKCPVPLKAKPARIFRTLHNLIEELLKKEKVAKGRLKGAGIGVPGIVRSNHRDILRTPNINLQGYPLADKLEKFLKAKVVLGNDVNLGLLGEKWLGVAQDIDDVIGLFPGTGVGGGIISGGKLLTGSDGAAGELGHMIIDLNSQYKSAGLFGTLEALCSRRAIERDIRQAMKQGKKSVIATWLGKNPRRIKSGCLSGALKLKDPCSNRGHNEHE